MAWEFRNGIPIYTQIVNEMSARIASGRYSPGQRLPSVRDLALEAGVNPNTMQRALTELERRGMIHTERTSGKFVSDRQDALKELNKKMAEKYVARMIQELMAMGMKKEEIVDEVLEGLKEV